MNKRVYKPHEFADKIGVSTRTLMRWDESGIFKAYRSPTNQKYYTETLYLDYLINSGMSIDEITASNPDINDDDIAVINRKRYLNGLAKESIQLEVIQAEYPDVSDNELDIIRRERDRLELVNNRKVKSKKGQGD